MNIFEGARRVMYATMALYSVIVIGIAVANGMEAANIAFWALIGGIFAIWLISLMTGWIVRGFLNIPLGMDRRPQAYR
jgi:CHASE3 domain sensor protein